jgi:signal transduction histidine kinase
MPLHTQSMESLLLKGSQAVLNALPCAIALWTQDRRLCALNYQARRLTGFSETDFLNERELWLSRVDALDRDAYLAAWEKLAEGKEVVSCDYRFLCKGETKTLWLRDVSGSFQGPNGETDIVVSAYTEISDLRPRRARDRGAARNEDVVSFVQSVVHEMQNSLHAVNMGLELISLGSERPLNCESIREGIERLHRLSWKLREYFTPAQIAFSSKHREHVLDDMLGLAQQELTRRGVRVRLAREALAPVTMLPNELQSAFRQIVHFCSLMETKGREMDVAVGIKELEGQKQLELTVTIPSTDRTPAEEFLPAGYSRFVSPASGFEKPAAKLTPSGDREERLTVVLRLR